MFKNKFCERLKTDYNAGGLDTSLSEKDFTQFLSEIYQKDWVVNSKTGFAGKSSVLEYLGRYTHKIAISNYRLLQLKAGKVTFSYRDRKAGDIQKVMTLQVDEFIKRFSWHILPKGFIKVRHYGLFATRVKQVKLNRVKR